MLHTQSSPFSWLTAPCPCPARLVDDTYTVEEVRELLDSLGDVVKAEVEGELLHASHTNSLLLTRLFKQAQKWHLTLDADTSDLENK